MATKKRKSRNGTTWESGTLFTAPWDSANGEFRAVEVVNGTVVLVSLKGNPWAKAFSTMDEAIEYADTMEDGEL